MTHDTSKMVSLKIAYFAGLCLEAVNFFSFLEAVKISKRFLFFPRNGHGDGWDVSTVDIRKVPLYVSHSY